MALSLELSAELRKMDLIEVKEIWIPYPRSFKIYWRISLRIKFWKERTSINDW